MSIIRRIWRNNSKHKKLSEEWALAECDSSAENWWGGAAECGGVVKYAGSAPVERAASAPATANAVQSALQIAKAHNKKLQRVNITITCKGIVATDIETSESVLNLSIYRISYCSADAAHSRVFAVVEGNDLTTRDGHDTYIAHVFVCDRRRYARAYALSLAHAFNDAYQTWQSTQQSSSVLKHYKKDSEPWVSFPDEYQHIDRMEQWNEEIPPLVNF